MQKKTFYVRLFVKHAFIVEFNEQFSNDEVNIKVQNFKNIFTYVCFYVKQLYKTDYTDYLVVPSRIGYRQKVLLAKLIYLCNRQTVSSGID